MFGHPKDVEGKCNAELRLSDDHGDGQTTCKCYLVLNHEGPHTESFEKRGGDVLITWNHDDRDEDKEELMMRRFWELADTWKEDRETRLLANPRKIAEHPAYVEIIQMGEFAIPLIIEDLGYNGPHHWFAALRAITGEDPIPPEHYGNMEAMTKDWIDWFKKKQSSSTKES